jgi:hypothetical protein
MNVHISSIQLLFVCLALNTNTYRTTKNREQPDVKRRYKKKSKIIRSFRRLHEKQIEIESKTNIPVLFLPKYTHKHTGNRNKARFFFPKNK